MIGSTSGALVALRLVESHSIFSAGPNGQVAQQNGLRQRAGIIGEIRHGFGPPLIAFGKLGEVPGRFDDR